MTVDVLADVDARRREAGARRAAAARDAGQAPDRRAQSIPCGPGREQAFRSEMRAQKVDHDGKSFYLVEGYATVYERGYEMWDWAGPYTEIVTSGAAEQTLNATPDVVFLVNHRGLAMARSVGTGGPAPNGSTLALWDDTTGMGDRAWLNPQRQDVKDLVLGIDDGVITEQSFAFMITSGQWSPDYTEYRINAFDIDRGDVSAVNYGANPHTSIAARSREILDALEHLPAGAARAAMDRLARRGDVIDLASLEPRGDSRLDEPAPQRHDPAPAAQTTEPAGASIALYEALLGIAE